MNGIFVDKFERKGIKYLGVTCVYLVHVFCLPRVLLQCIPTIPGKDKYQLGPTKKRPNCLKVHISCKVQIGEECVKYML